LLMVGGGGFHRHAGLAFASIAGFGLLSLVVGWLPMKWGLKHLKNFEA